MSCSKCKLNQDAIATIIADWEDGELTKCDCECEDCPLVVVSSIYGETLCTTLTNLSQILCEEKSNGSN